MSSLPVTRKPRFAASARTASPAAAALVPTPDLGAFVALDAEGGLRVQDLRLVWLWRNLLSEEYELIPGHPAPGRHATLWIRWEFWD